jgi:preprotein translocase subunit SecY
MVLVIVAVVLITQAVGMLKAGVATTRDAILPIGMIVGSLVAFGAYYYALFLQTGVFAAFRGVLGCAAGMLSLYFVGSGIVDVQEMLAGSFKAAELTGPLTKFVGAAVILLGFYFALVARTGVRRVMENIFSIPELLKKLAFTLALLCIYRVGFQIPLPGLNQEELARAMQRAAEGPLGQAMEYFAMFTGGNLQQCTLFGLGIMPYISASIIFQLLVAVVPALERLQKEGPSGYKKIQEYTRYATVVLCIVQAVGIWITIMRPNLYPDYAGSIGVFLMGVAGLTCGTVFLMWLGEQIDEYGIGNGISLIIMAGIVSRLPHAIRELIERASLKVTATGGEIGLIKIVFLIASFIFVVAGSILICQAQRRIPIQQAKHTRGRRVYGGQRQYLPLRVNHGGVLPIIFASSLLLFPNALSRMAVQAWPGSAVASFFARAFTFGDLIHQLSYVGLIFFFAYFWTTVQFRPRDMSDQLRDQGHFIPGLRPGKRTADYLERVMERITYCGAGFLAAIAVIPQLLAEYMKIPWRISGFLGGTGLLIMVSVALDLVQRIEANLIMRNYGGLLGDAGRIRGVR